MKKVIPECKECGSRSFFVKWTNMGSMEITNPKGTWEDQTVVQCGSEGLLDPDESEVECQKCRTRLEDEDILFVLDFILGNHLHEKESISGRRPLIMRAWSKKPISEVDRIK